MARTIKWQGYEIECNALPLPSIDQGDTEKKMTRFSFKVTDDNGNLVGKVFDTKSEIVKKPVKG